MGRALRAVARRWPTALGIASAAASLGGGSETDQSVTGLGESLYLLPLLYVTVAKLRRPSASWPTLVVLIAGFVALRAIDVVPTSAGVSAVALVVLVWGAIDGHLLRDGWFRAQVFGMIAFGVIAFVGLILDPSVGGYVVAAGWFFHGVWDFVHLKLDRVVVRSYAEWCGVLDVLTAVGLVLAL